MEAADEHPEDLPWESSPLDPNSDDFQEACPDADPAGSKTILGREAVGYACTWKGPAEGMDQPEKLWLDKATRMLLEYGAMKATEFALDPEIDEKTFSTKPPAGADVDVVKATGKGPPPPDEEEPAPEDALATIASTSPIPIYYLGPEFEGMALSEVAIFDDVSGSEVEGDMSIDDGQSLVLFYGEDFQMSTTRFVPDHYRNSEGCSRLQPLRSVPTVEQSDAVSLISADLVIWLAVVNPRQAAPAAAALVEVGKEPTASDLPAPPARNVALIDHACGAKPGDHGMLRGLGEQCANIDTHRGASCRQVRCPTLSASAELPVRCTRWRLAAGHHLRLPGPDAGRASCRENAPRLNVRIWLPSVSTGGSRARFWFRVRGRL